MLLSFSTVDAVVLWSSLEHRIMQGRLSSGTISWYRSRPVRIMEDLACVAIYCSQSLVVLLCTNNSHVDIRMHMSVMSVMSVTTTRQSRAYFRARLVVLRTSARVNSVQVMHAKWHPPGSPKVYRWVPPLLAMTWSPAVIFTLARGGMGFKSFARQARVKQICKCPG